MSSKKKCGELYKISDVSRLYDVTPRALRFYEKQDLLQPIRKGGARFYDDKQIARLKLVMKGKQLGFSLGEIAEMLDASSTAANEGNELPLDRETLLSQLDHLEKRRSEIDRAIYELQEYCERCFGHRR
jgi:DNA-binding transcriptional MerR regulator